MGVNPDNTAQTCKFVTLLSVTYTWRELILDSTYIFLVLMHSAKVQIRLYQSRATTWKWDLVTIDTFLGLEKDISNRRQANQRHVHPYFPQSADVGRPLFHGHKPRRLRLSLCHHDVQVGPHKQAFQKSGSDTMGMTLSGPGFALKATRRSFPLVDGAAAGQLYTRRVSHCCLVMWCNVMCINLIVFLTYR